MGFSSIHKCIIAIKMLAYGGPADSMDDACCIAESTVLATVKEFIGTINKISLVPKFIRAPTENEINNILQVNEPRGFPGMIGSMHWEWAKCLTGWHEIFMGHKGKSTIILEVVATEDLRI
jgi:hypothetical protein